MVAGRRAYLAEQVARLQFETISHISAKLIAANDEQAILVAVASQAEQYGVTLSTLSYFELDDQQNVAVIYNMALLDGQGKLLPLNTFSSNRFLVSEFPIFKLFNDYPDQLVIVEDFATDPRFAESATQEFVKIARIEASVMIPLRTSTEWQGCLIFNWDKPQTFSADMLKILTAIKPIASAVVASRRAYLAEQHARHQADTISKISSNLSQAQSDQEILDAVAKLAEEHGVTMSTLSYLEVGEDDKPNWLINLALQDGQGQPLPLDSLPSTRHDLSNFPVFDLAWEHPDRLLFVEDFLSDPRYANEAGREFVKAANIMSMIVLPLKQGNQWHGTLIFNWDTPQKFKPDLRDIFKAIQPTATAVMARRRLVMDMERMIEERTRQLAQERDFISVVLETTDLLVVVLAPQGHVVRFNHACERTTGYTASEIVDHFIWEFLLPPEQIESVKQVFQELAIDQMPNKYEGEWLTKDGQRRLIAWSNTILRYETGEVQFVIATGIDVTEQRQAEVEREQLQEEIIDSQRRAIQELSTPIIPVMEGVIVMPLIGSIDSLRAKDLMQNLLSGISEQRAKIVILDITGVPIVDTGVVAHLDKSIQAARLKGARTIVTGISDAVAESIVDLGIDWSKVETLRDLQTGLVVALKSLGLKLAG